MVWDAIPQQLAKEKKKFKYSAVKTGSRANDYLLAIQLLLDAGLVYTVTRISTPKVPLRFFEESSVFKLYMNDVGMLGAQMDAPAEDVLLGNNVFSAPKSTSKSARVNRTCCSSAWRMNACAAIFYILLKEWNVFVKPNAEGKSRSVCTMLRRENDS